MEIKAQKIREFDQVCKYKYKKVNKKMRKSKLENHEEKIQNKYDNELLETINGNIVSINLINQ